jgi:hypothetical protein
MIYVWYTFSECSPLSVFPMISASTAFEGKLTQGNLDRYAEGCSMLPQPHKMYQYCRAYTLITQYFQIIELPSYSEAGAM